MNKNHINEMPRREGKTVIYALNVYDWLKTAENGSVGIIFLKDRTIKVTIQEVEK